MCEKLLKWAMPAAHAFFFIVSKPMNIKKSRVFLVILQSQWCNFVLCTLKWSLEECLSVSILVYII